MSIRSLAVTARRRRAPAVAVRPPTSGTWPASATGNGESTAPGEGNGADTLVEAVPTEVIALYTTVLGVLTGVVKDDPLATYLPLRWVLYGGCILGTAAAFFATYAFTGTPAAKEPGGEDPAASRLPPLVGSGTPQPAPSRPEDKTRKSEPPVAEACMGCFSFAVWGLVIPGSPLYVVLHAPTLPVVVTVLGAVGTFLATSIFAPWLRRGVKQDGH
ncbi:hypothetical protein ACIRST_09930 [Kitasatospora sp. NPDC101447]|uniref:hypothetical protein n=1 Tax=Kitasatospora sp. NPDC101447 TaxID=3364102 RepID=UPI0037F99337